MSLDDETPTQYFGPGAEVWRRPDGQHVQVDPARIGHLRGRLEADGWIHTGQQPLIFGPRVISLDNITLDPLYEDLFHRPGCSVQRTGRCICAYLTQWDTTGYLAPTFRKDQP